MAARLECMDALVEVAYAASDVLSQQIDNNEALKKRKNELSGKPQVRYGRSDLNAWKQAFRRAKAAVAYLSGRNHKPSDDRFKEMAQEAYATYSRFAKVTHTIVDEGIPRLNDVAGKILWANQGGK